MNNISNELKYFLEQKEKVAKDLSDIIGFDFRLLKHHQSKNKNFLYETIEQDFTGFSLGQPIFFAFKRSLSGLSSYFTEQTGNSLLCISCENGNWRVKNENRSKLVTPEELKNIALISMRDINFSPEKYKNYRKISAHVPLSPT